MKVMTWNVLHRVHAENYAEPAIVRWPDEPLRVSSIADLVATALTTGGCRVAMLQEASGDVVSALSARLPAGFVVCAHAFPRLPRFKVASRTTLVDAREHVAVVGPAGTELLQAETYADDPGKGFVLARLGSGVVAVSTHVTWGPKGLGQMQALQRVLKGIPGAVLVGGDFNAEGTQVQQALGDSLVLATLPPGSPRTRPAPEGGADIDHLVCRGGTWSAVHALDHLELSDHRPLVATVEL